MNRLLSIILFLLFLFFMSCGSDGDSVLLSTVETPTFDLAGGTYFGTQNITLTVTSPNGATVIYTTDNTAPAADAGCSATNGTAMPSGDSASIGLSGTLRAIGCNAGWTTSTENTAIYTIEFRTFTPTDAFNGDLITEEGNSLTNGALAADALCMADTTNKPAGCIEKGCSFCRLRLLMTAQADLLL